jgi:hypothetical protein
MYVSFFLKCRMLNPRKIQGTGAEESQFRVVHVPLDVNIRDVDEPSNVAAPDFVAGC